MPGLVDEEYVSMTLEFRCNLACAHCMIEGTMDYLQAEPPEKFNELLAYNAANRRWSGLIMTGSEITLRHDQARPALLPGVIGQQLLELLQRLRLEVVHRALDHAVLACEVAPELQRHRDVIVVDQPWHKLNVRTRRKNRS